MHVVIGTGIFSMILGAGVGTAWPHINSYALQLIPQVDAARSGSILSVTEMFAVSFGAAVSGMIVNASGFNNKINLDHVAHSANALFTALTVLGVVATIAMWVFLYHYHEREPEAEISY